MKRQKFDILMMLLTLSFGMLGSIVCLLAEKKLSDSYWGQILWTGLFFAIPLLCSLTGSFLAELLHSGKFRILRQGSRIVSTILTITLGFTLGAGGQALYMISASGRGTDLILLLDGSDSMKSYNEICQETACNLVDKIKSENRVQAVAFAGTILGKTELLEMDESGKEEIKSFIREINVMGGTNFDIALNEAQNSLSKLDSAERKKAVVMLTDGQGTAGSATQQTYLEEEIILYTIRISQNAEIGSQEQNLIDFSENTGGFDTFVQVTNGGILYEDMLKAFEKAFGASSVLGVSNRMLIYGKAKESVLWCLAIRIFAFGLYAVLTAQVYYQRQKKAQVLSNVITGVIAAVAISILGQLGIGTRILSAVIICVLMLGAYTAYYPSGGDIKSEK